MKKINEIDKKNTNTNTNTFNTTIVPNNFRKFMKVMNVWMVLFMLMTSFGFGVEGQDNDSSTETNVGVTQCPQNCNNSSSDKTLNQGSTKESSASDG